MIKCSHAWLYAVPFGDLRVCKECSEMEALDDLNDVGEEVWISVGKWTEAEDPVGVKGWVAT